MKVTVKFDESAALKPSEVFRWTLEDGNLIGKRKVEDKWVSVSWWALNKSGDPYRFDGEDIAPPQAEVDKLRRDVNILPAGTTLPANWLGVQFFDLDSENPLQGSCLVTSEAMCKTQLEKSAFKAACEVEDIVCMGKLVCKPVIKK